MTLKRKRLGQGRNRAALAWLVVGLLVLLPVQTAHAAGTVQVSADGVTFGSTFPGVLFDGVAKIVPGDVQSETFYVRNTGPDAGYLRLTLRNVSGTLALVQNLSVSASVPAKPGSAVGLASVAPCWVLNEGIFLAAGATVAVTADLRFDFAAVNITQSSTASFDIGVSLTDTAIALPPTECGGSDTDIPGTTPQPGELGHTGGEIPVALIGAAAFILGVGVFFLVFARRRNRGDDDKAGGK